MARDTDIARSDERTLAQPRASRSPYWAFDRFADDVDRFFDDFGFGRGWMTPRLFRDRSMETRQSADWGWTPEVEVFHRGSELIIRADLPGLKKEDVKVDVTEDRVTIEGERRREHKEEREGFYRSERSYGTFYREVPLPPGTMSDQAKATFNNGVLEVTMPAPPESARRGRRLEISDKTL